MFLALNNISDAVARGQQKDIDSIAAFTVYLFLGVVMPGYFHGNLISKIDILLSFSAEEFCARTGLSVEEKAWSAVRPFLKYWKHFDQSVKLTMDSCKSRAGDFNVDPELLRYAEEHQKDRYDEGAATAKEFIEVTTGDYLGFYIADAPGKTKKEKIANKIKTVTRALVDSNETNAVRMCAIKTRQLFHHRGTSFLIPPESLWRLEPPELIECFRTLRKEFANDVDGARGLDLFSPPYIDAELDVPFVNLTAVDDARSLAREVMDEHWCTNPVWHLPDWHLTSLDWCPVTNITQLYIQEFVRAPENPQGLMDWLMHFFVQLGEAVGKTRGVWSAAFVVGDMNATLERCAAGNLSIGNFTLPTRFDKIYMSNVTDYTSILLAHVCASRAMKPRGLFVSNVLLNTGLWADYLQYIHSTTRIPRLDGFPKLLGTEWAEGELWKDLTFRVAHPGRDELASYEEMRD